MLVGTRFGAPHGSLRHTHDREDELSPGTLLLGVVLRDSGRRSVLVPDQPWTRK